MVRQNAAVMEARVDEEEEESDDEIDEIPDHLRQIAPTRVRTSVSAEAYGQWNQKREFVPPRYEKTAEQMGRLNMTLSSSFLFQELERSDMDTLLLAMREQVFEAGYWFFHEGDDGDFLFVLESGEADCIKNLDGEATVVKQCSAGDVFGELALLYNCPRAAGVVARSRCVCWQLDRETFNHIVRDASVKRRDRYDAFLRSVALLSSLGPYERAQIAECLHVEIFQRGETIIRQGEPGEKFYIVEQGSLLAYKDDAHVMTYNPGDCFGELALMNDQPRAASVLVGSDSCQVLSMSRASFTKMLGPLGNILQRSYC